MVTGFYRAFFLPDTTLILPVFIARRQDRQLVQRGFFMQ